MPATNYKQQETNRIYLIGMMGVGKTTKGKKIAQLLGYSFLDLDKEIEKQSKSTIQKIFEEKGEQYFRKLESEVLRSIEKNNIVIATGGGTPCYFENMSYIKNTGISIYLKAKTGLILQRISRNTDKRPLLKGMEIDQIRSFIDQKIMEREPFYLESDLLFEIPSTSAESIVESIISANT